MSRHNSRIAALLFALALVAGAQPAQSQTPPPAPAPGAPAPAPAATVAPGAPAPGAEAAAAPGVQPGAPGAQPAAPAVGPGGLLVPSSEFRYDPTGRRDPFKSLLQLEQKQRAISQLPPIQQLDIESLKVVGVIADPERGAQAMVKGGPNNQTFVVRVGTIIGKNEGEIVEITLKGIRIVEKFLDFMNRETRKETFLKSHPTVVK